MKNMKAEKKFSRLPRHVRPHRYNLIIEPDLKKFTFKGKEIIFLNLAKATAEITLHSKNLKISNVIYQTPGGKISAKQIKIQPGQETATFKFAKPLSKGDGELHLEFSGRIAENLRGFYRSSFEYNGKKHHIAATQFEATDARAAFPCFDEPAAKAIFDITLIAPKSHTAISNTLPTEVWEHSTGYQAIKFAPTPKMSTYLVAYIFGNFEFIEGKTKRGVQVRVFATPGKKKQSEFALDVAIRAIDFYEEYFDIDYPLPILDMAALPDFAAGAMENWGLVTYRETTLLIDPEHSSLANKQHVALVIAHELAHQWFGNLVTMEWWTHLWLNEGFASYIEYLALEHMFPQWKMWDQFVFETFTSALALDALKNTHPIEVAVHHPREIDEIFDQISYEKGSSVIRMLANYLGEKDFRNGLRLYLKRHAYQNAETTDLWDALQKVSKKPVRKIMENWTGKAGYPVVSVKTNGEDLELSQQRFFSSAISAKETNDQTLWQIPVSVQKINSKIIQKFLMSVRKQKLSGIKAGDSYKLNIGQSAFFRTEYDAVSLALLKKAIKNNKLSAIDRLGIISDAFALARAGKIKTSKVLDLLTAYSREDDYNVWVEISAGLGSISHLLYQQKSQKQFHQFAKQLYLPLANKLGWQSKKGEGHSIPLLRSLILGNAGKYGDQATIGQAKQLFAQIIKGRHINPDIRGLVYSLSAQNSGTKEYAQLLRLYMRSELHEEKVRIIHGLSSFKQQELARKTLNFAMSKHVRSQDLRYFYIYLMSGDNSRDFTWQFLKRNLNKLKVKFGQGGHMLSRIIGATVAFISNSAANDVQAFFKKNPVEGSERTIQQSLEAIRSKADWLKRDIKDIEEYLLNLFL